MSAAYAIKDHMRDWYFGTPKDEYVSMGVYINENSCYGIPKDLVFSMPVICKNFKFEVVNNLKLIEF